VTPGGGCSNAVVSTRAELAQGSITTIALVGTVNPTGNNNAPLEIVLLADDVTAPPSSALMRFIDAAPTVAAAALGTGDLAHNDFVPIFPDAEYATASMRLGDGGTADSNGYAIVTAPTGVELSAHAVGGTTDLATAAHSPALPGTATTIVLINGAGAMLPQLLGCTDSAAPSGALSACQVLIPQ
jgi:hypothetical protein